MLPCLTIRYSQATTLTRPPPLLIIHRVTAARRGTVVLPPAEIATVHQSAVAFLCQLGFTAIDATTLLTQTGSSVDAVRIQAVCETLLRVTKVPVARLPGVLRQSPQLLSLDPQAISEHYESLSRAWPSQRQLQKIVISYSDVLKPSFAAALRRCMAALQGMGFSKAQTAAAVTSCPKLAGVRHYEMAAALRKCGLPSKIEDTAMFELLSKNPEWLTPEGSRTLEILLETVRKGTGLAPDKAQFIVARAKHINLRKKREIRQIMGLLRRFGFSQPEIANMCVEWPSLCSQRPSTVDHVLKVLKFYKQTPEKVAQFPKVFLCKPLQPIGPRLAFLQEHNPYALPSLALSTVLGSSDARFLQLRASKEVLLQKKCHFDAFKANWLVEHEWWVSDDEEDGSSSNSSGSEEEERDLGTSSCWGTNMPAR